MTLTAAMFSSISGIDSNSTAIAVIGDNIANINTPGFKQKRVEFADVLSRSITAGGGLAQLGAGVKTNRIIPIYSQGTFESTARGTDLAIDGQGFFILEDDSGVFYTRDGSFHFDEERVLVNGSGFRVQGFALNPVTGISTGELGNISLDETVSAPRATTLMELSVQLDSNDTNIPGGFDASDPDNTSNFRTAFTTFDTLGNPHLTTFFFTKTADNTWTYNAALGVNDTTTAPASAGDEFVVMTAGGTGTLTFDTNGDLSAMVPDPASVTFEYAGGGAASQAITLNLGPVAGTGTGDPTTQYGSDSLVNSFVQDGFAPGELQNVIFDPEGFVSGQFSNGQTIRLAQIALAQFPNTEGLLSVGDNNVTEARLSGQPVIGVPESGAFGELRSSSLEKSNVDLAAQFVQLIISQRAFQANTRTVSTASELLGNLVSLGQ